MKKTIQGRPQILVFTAFLLAVLGCNAPSLLTSIPASSPPASRTLPSLPSETPLPEATPELGGAPPPSPVPPTAPAEIIILGEPDFAEQTRSALLLLEEEAPDAYAKVMRYVGAIEQSDRSGMWAYEVPPRYAVSKETAFYSLSWYASTIAHDATHSELYHEYLAAHPGEPVPDDVWTGFEAERFCNAYQLDVLTRIGGTANEVDYLAGLTGTHCDVDGDHDCDWDDYEGRDW